MYNRTYSKNARRLLLVGDWRYDIYEEALKNGFEEHGWTVVTFRTIDYLPSGRLAKQVRRLRPALMSLRLNEAIIEKARVTQCNIIFLIRCDEILYKTLCDIRKVSPQSIIFTYHNDNPYVGYLRRYAMRHFLNCIKEVDVTLVYRHSDIRSALDLGAKKVSLLLPYYMSNRHIPTDGGEKNDVIYIGHYENDGRENILNSLYEAGITVRVYGTGWESVQKHMKWLAKQEIRQVWGKEYVSLLSGSKIAMVFLSGRNKDVYTRRCFEIPACGTMMIAPYTKELSTLFVESKEAVFWTSTEDLIDKIKYYLQNDVERDKIGLAGLERVKNDSHNETGRALEIIKLYNETIHST